MKYPDGQLAHIGDLVGLGKHSGCVVCSIDTNEYSEEHSFDQWGYLKEGVMIEFPELGLIHYVDPEPNLRLLGRK
jgi:hypothetical protein